jgi:HK97 family phage portal protein
METMRLLKRRKADVSADQTADERKYSLAGPLMAWGILGRAKWTPRRYDRLAEEGYARNVVAFRCIREIAQSAASVPLLLFQGEAELIAHPVLDLLARPNPRQGKVAFLESMITQLLIAGNAYVEAVGDGEPVELWTLRADRMQVVPGRHGLPAGYEYTVGGQSRRWAADPVDGQSPILHLGNYHPLEDWYGFSPLEAAARAIDQYNAAEQWNQALLQNGCRPSGALSIENRDGPLTLSPEQYERLKAELQEQYAGSVNAGRPILLEGGLKWTDMMLSPKDMDFLNAKYASARDIALAFGYPPMLLGIPGDNTYANQKEARLALWEQTILPLLTVVLDGLNHWLLPRFGDGLGLTHDEDAISALNPRREMLWARINAATFLSEEEKRQAVGYEARPRANS